MYFSVVLSWQKLCSERTSCRALAIPQVREAIEAQEKAEAAEEPKEPKKKKRKKKAAGPLETMG